MKWTWTWSGQCFGYWDGDELRTHRGKHVGRRAGDEVFGPTGRYLGEVMGGHERLITNMAKAAQKGAPFKPLEAKAALPIQVNAGALVLYKGYLDFPHPDML